MQYRLRISKKVEREIERLPGKVRQRVRRTIASLAFDPRPQHATELEEELAGFWRIKIEDYRIIYTIKDELVVVEIMRVVRRSPRTYQGLV
jgi:mRNA interferase RelE/StbE